MIIVYTTPACQSCKKTTEWLQDNKISYVEKNIFASLLEPKELSKILDASEEGFDSIISKRSNFYKESNINFDTLTFNDAQKILIENPSIIKRPIIINDEVNIIQVGFNKDDLGVFRNIVHHECPNDKGDCSCNEKVHQDLYDQLRFREIKLEKKAKGVQ